MTGSTKVLISPRASLTKAFGSSMSNKTSENKYKTKVGGFSPVGLYCGTYLPCFLACRSMTFFLFGDNLA